MAIKTIKKEVPDRVYENENGKSIEVFREQHPEDPLVFDSAVVLECSHGRYDLGDKDAPTDKYDSWAGIRGKIEDENNVLAIRPLFLLDHSGISISTTPFQSSWDSGKVGWAYITEESADEIGIRDQDRETEKLEQWIEARVSNYDDYLRQNIFRYVLKDEDGEELDACGGIYGMDLSRICEIAGEDEDEYSRQ